MLQIAQLLPHVCRPAYPREESSEEVIQEAEGELKMEEEIQEDMMEDSEDEGGTFLDLTAPMGNEVGGAAQKVSVCTL